MDNQELKKFIGNINMSLSQIMQKIDVNANGILFIVDDEEKIVGCITDGDIRRFLLSGGKIDDKAIQAANKSPRFAHTLDEAKEL